MRWLGNVRYPLETTGDLSDPEWLEAVREHYGDERPTRFRVYGFRNQHGLCWTAPNAFQE